MGLSHAHQPTQGSALNLLCYLILTHQPSISTAESAQGQDQPTRTAPVAHSLPELFKLGNPKLPVSCPALPAENTIKKVVCTFPLALFHLLNNIVAS